MSKAKDDLQKYMRVAIHGDEVEITYPSDQPENAFDVAYANVIAGYLDKDYEPTSISDHLEDIWDFYFVGGADDGEG